MKQCATCSLQEPSDGDKDSVLEAYRYLVHENNLPTYLTCPQHQPRYIQGHRSKCLNDVESLVTMMVRAVELEETSTDLKRRIAALPALHDKNRPVPNTSNPVVLGTELKLRLAAISPVIGERAGPKQRILVEKKRKKRTFIPLHDINNEEDFTAKCHVPLNNCKSST